MPQILLLEYIWLAQVLRLGRHWKSHEAMQELDQLTPARQHKPIGRLKVGLLGILAIQTGALPVLLNDKQTNILNMKISLWWLLANIAGSSMYLWLESKMLSPQPEGYEYNGIDELHLWATKEFPLLITFSIVNAIFGIYFLKQRQPLAKIDVCSVAITCCIWAIALFYHGFILKAGGIVVGILVR